MQLLIKPTEIRRGDIYHRGRQMYLAVSRVLDHPTHVLLEGRVIGRNRDGAVRIIKYPRRLRNGRMQRVTVTRPF